MSNRSFVVGLCFLLLVPAGIPAASDGDCSDHDVVASLDLDPGKDSVYHDWSQGSARLGACTSEGLHDEIAGLGQSEALEIGNVQRDARDEIFYGATLIAMRGFQVAVFRDGELLVVRRGGGRALVLKDGEEADHPHTTYAFGCRDRNGDGRRDLDKVKVFGKKAPFEWSRHTFTLWADRARKIAKASGLAEKAASRHVVIDRLPNRTCSS